MSEAEFLLNHHSGELVVRGADQALLTTLATRLGAPEDLDCGQCPPPAAGEQPLIRPEKPGLIRVAGFLHQSVVDGPGLRSVLFLQGCPIRCPKCRNPQAHDLQSGSLTSLDAVLAELLGPDQPRDGVTISGGEPLAQAEACAELVARVKAAGVHVVVYTGYTYEQLAQLKDPAVRRVLALADVLVDGPFLAALDGQGLAYRGSSNQRVIDLTATRKARALRVLGVD